MVRVISVHHFSRQDVSAFSGDDPCAVVCAGDVLLVARQDHAMETRDLEHNSASSVAFHTIDRVRQLLHSPVQDYVVTLEGGGCGDPVVRAYVNWRGVGVADAPIRPRIAGRVSPGHMSASSSSAKTSDDGDDLVAPFLDVVEFSQTRTGAAPLTVALCPTTGNLLVGAANLLVVYRCVLKCRTAPEKVTLASKVENAQDYYIDFEECVHVLHEFIPMEVAFCEDVLACLMPTEVHIFKVKTRNDDRTERPGRRSSLITTDTEDSIISEQPDLDLESSFSSSSSSSDYTNVKQTRKSPPINVTQRRRQDSEVTEGHLEGYAGNVRRHKAHVCKATGDGELQEVRLPEVEEANSQLRMLAASGGNSPKIMDQILGPTAPPADRPTTVKCVLGQKRNHKESSSREEVEMECVTLVFCRLLKKTECLLRESFANLRIEPVYWREFRFRGGVDSIGNPLQSDKHQHLVSLTACFTSQSEGFLFHLPGHLRRKSSSKKGLARRIATYPFTSRVRQTALEASALLFHALTDTGLETYTLLKSGYHTTREAETLDDRRNACPGDGEEDHNPICLVGLRPFLGAKHLVLAASHLVLLSRDDAFDGEWTVYSLKLPSPLDLHRDMLHLANMNRSASPQGYLQLLCEAHVLLRTFLRQLSWRLRPDEDHTDLTSLFIKVRDRYRETCTLLARHYVLAADEKSSLLALPYFRLSGRLVSSNLAYAMEAWASIDPNFCQDFPPGLRHYLVDVVLRPTKEENLVDSSLADKVIQLLGDHSPETLCMLVLSSPSFRSFKTSSMLEKLSTKCEKVPLSARRAVALSLLWLEQSGGEEEALSTLEMSCRLSPVSLSSVLIEHSDLLLDSRRSGFSDFAMLLQSCTPELFAEVLVSLIRSSQSHFTLDETLTLFLGRFVTSPDASASHNSSMLQLFLETYFIELLASAEEQTIDSRKDQTLGASEEQALCVLVRSYLTSLSLPVKFGERDIDADMFGSRKHYLDKLPPFGDRQQPVASDNSPDFWCQNALLKLQSLLSSSSLALPSCNQTVLKYLDSNANLMGQDSLRILSCDCAEDSLALLCLKHPNVLLLYARESNLTNEQWSQVLAALQQSLDGDPMHPMHEAWYSAMQELLDHLAQVMTLTDFLSVLPSGPKSGKNSEEFQGYIQMCRRNQQAADIQALIVSTGHKLLSTLSF